MDIGKLLSQGGMVAVIGLVIVFFVLIILMVLLELLRVIFEKLEKKQADKINGTLSQQPMAIETTPEKKESINDEELVAVITAAIAASLNTSTYNLRITSLKRVNNWKSAARQETIF